jgi:hypothetical protein
MELMFLQQKEKRNWQFKQKCTAIRHGKDPEKEKQYPKIEQVYKAFE